MGLSITVLPTLQFFPTFENYVQSILYLHLQVFLLFFKNQKTKLVTLSFWEKVSNLRAKNGLERSRIVTDGVNVMAIFRKWYDYYCSKDSTIRALAI